MKLIRPARIVSTLAAIAALTLTGCDDILGDFPDLGLGSNGGSTGASDSLYNDLGMDEGQARDALEGLPIEKPHGMAKYSRDRFPHWRSASKWGWKDVPDASDCDAREAALSRDGDDVEVNDSTCTPTSGTWIDPYTGNETDDPGQLDIDHMVPLAAAWRAGADKWTDDQRTTYANAPLVMVTSDASANRAKGDKGPEAWKPENEGARCGYAIRWIAVKDEFDLNLTSKSEHDALVDMLDTCDDDATSN